MVAKKKVEKVLRLPPITPIPLLGTGAHLQLEAITDKYDLPAEPIHHGLMTIYFDHQDLWLRSKAGPNTNKWRRQKSGSKVLKRSAATINTKTRNFMSMLTDNPTWAELLCLGDINTLTKLLNRLLENSRIAKGAKAARGRAKDPLAIAVADDLGKLYDEYCPSSRHRALRGESRSAVRIDFVHDTLKLFDLDLSKDTIRTYREKKNSLRSASNAPPVDELSQGAGPDFAGPPPGIAPGPTGPQGPSVDDEIAPLEADPGEGAP